MERTRYGARPACRAIDGQRIAPCLMASHSENVMFMQIVENISLALPGAVLPRRRRSIRQVLTRPGSGGICENRTLSGASYCREGCPRESAEREIYSQAFGNVLLTDWIPACAGMTMARECGHQVRNRGRLPLRDVKNEDRSDYVHENAG